jgi:hypothetical protein
VSNETDSLLALWVEPWGTDHWMRPGEELTVVTEASEDSGFNVVVHDQGITVWVESARSALVLTKNGNEAPCGYQRPAAGHLWQDGA